MNSMAAEARKKLSKALLDAAKGGGEAGASRVSEMLSGRAAGRIGYSKISEEMLKTLQARTSLMIDSLIDGSVEAFKRGLGANFSIEAEVDRLMKGHPTFSRSRATTIARTESANAYHEGQIDAWKQLDVVKEKHFIVAPGACQFCKAMDQEYGPGKKSLPIESKLLQKGQKIKGTEGGTMTVGIDSHGNVHPNCRCDVRPVIDLDA